MFHPITAQWFTTAFADPTEAQRRCWDAITAGGDVLLSAPTGSGKTLAAFLWSLDELVRQGLAGDMPPGCQVLYISPLRALTNDVAQNLDAPMQGLRDVAAAMGHSLPPIRTFVRSGDTPAAQRQKMGRQAPHIVVTTPESLHILLTSASGRLALRHVRWVIVDEIHALYGSKRGTHLALSLERLEHLVLTSGGARPRRLALSATVEPLAGVASFLAGSGRPPPAIIEVGRTRPLDISVLTPDDELGAVASGSVRRQCLDRIAALTLEHRQTLVFVQTRRQVERFAHELRGRLAPIEVGAHHGALSREQRLRMEERLKSGELRVMVASSSLELGIDIGNIDVVLQVDAPRTVGAFLQRLGRSRHQVGGTPKAIILPMTRDALVEAAALVHSARRGLVDHLDQPEAPLDILAQVVVAEVACGPWSEQALYDLVRRAWPFRALDRATWDAVLDLHTEGVALRWGRSTALLHHDRELGELRPRRGARLIATTSGGAIPDRADYQVVLDPVGTSIGTLDEDFAIESMAGDVILLGAQTWRITRVEPGRVRVVDAAGASPTVPFWLGEGPGRSRELSAAVALLRAHAQAVFDAAGDEGALERTIRDDYGVDAGGAAQIVRYMRASWEALGTLPDTTTFVAERFFDDAGGMQLVVHAPLGARLLRIWGLALRKRFCKTFDFELQAAANDDSILLSLGPQHSFPLAEIWDFLSPATVREVALQAVLTSQFFPARWRWAATRSLAVPRWGGGRRVPPPLLRMRCDDLMAAVFPAAVACQEGQPPAIEAPDHPLVREALRECLEDAFDLPALERVIGEIVGGRIRLREVDTREASPLSHAVLNAAPYAFLDDAPLEERRSRAVTVRRTLGGAWSDAAKLDPEIIDAVATEAAPLVRDADELHDVLSTLIRVPRVHALQWFQPMGGGDALRVLGAAGRLREDTQLRLWVADRQALVAAMDHAHRGDDAFDNAVHTLVRHWVQHLGPFTPGTLAAAADLDLHAIDAALARLEADGVVLRGRFDERLPEGPQWCERRVLARIHKRCLEKLRKEAQPVTPAVFQSFLTRWTAIHPEERAAGQGGFLSVVRRLQHWFAPAAAWEPELLAPRVRGSVQSLVDAACLRGELVWGRLTDDSASTFHRGVAITFALRDELGAWHHPTSVDERQLSAAAKDVVGALRQHGASFLTDLRTSTQRLPAEIDAALLEGIGAGLLTADGFSAARTLFKTGSNTTRGVRRGSRSSSRPWGTTGGRWALLPRPATQADPEAVATQLLRRWGVVVRDLAAREVLPCPWRDVLGALRTLEMRGVVHGGRFIDGLVGEQFAAPDAVESLRAEGRRATPGPLIVISGVDPLNLTALWDGGPRVPAAATARILLRDGSVLATWDGRSENRRAEGVAPQWWRRIGAIEPTGFPLRATG